MQTAKLYGIEHVKFGKSVDIAFERFQAAFKEKPDLVFGIVGEELAFEKEVMFDLSKATRPMIIYLKSRSIERMDFYSPMLKEELQKFLVFLVTPKEELKKEPQEHLMILGIRNINVGHIKSAEERVGLGAVDDLKLYESSLENFNQTLDNVLENKEVDYLDLQFNVSNIFESLTNRHQELLKLTVLKRYDQVTFAHILNVSVLSIFFASKLGLPREEVLEIGIAALFHDIGKTHVSRKIIKKTDKLTDEEFEAVKGHTVFGAEILLKYVDTLGQLPVLAAFEHHLKSGFQGYPKMPYPRKPHLGSAIIGVCDIYDALSARRSYKTSMPPLVVYGILLKEKEKLHFPELVDDFFKIMGVFPIGTLVVLSDSRIGVVRLQYEGDIFFPQVEVVYPADKREVLNLKGNTAGLKIEKSLDPFVEGQPYVSLI
ncbi:MAG: HD domain-containing protein [Candidatus Omnitrophica bacterium]|nr:HD domain-containing protein [Candidatus Omnitrophota bacterium]